MLSHKIATFETEGGGVKRLGGAVPFTLKPWGEEIDLNARYIDISGTSGNLTHLQVEVPESAEDGNNFWLRVLTNYQGLTHLKLRECDVSAIEKYEIRRSEILALVALSHPQKYSAVEFRHISRKTVDEGARIDRQRERKSGHGLPVAEYSLGISSSVSGLLVGPHTGVNVWRVALACLAPKFIEDPDCIKRYQKFETGLMRMCDRLDSKFSSNPKLVFMQMMVLDDYLNRYSRDHVDDVYRQNLYMLHAACDTAMMDMYHYVVAGALKDPGVLRGLDDASLKYNSLAHSVQDRLGGIVPALHPVWSLCLHSRPFVDSLIGYVSDPKSDNAIGRLDQNLITALLTYKRLTELEESLRENDRISASGDNETEGKESALADRRSLAADQRAVVDDIVATIRGLSKGDQDIAVFIEVLIDGKTPEILATELSCTEKAVQRRKERGQEKLRNLLRKMGYGSEELAIFAERQRGS